MQWTVYKVWLYSEDAAMNRIVKLFSIICVVSANAAHLPSSITPCSRSLPSDKLSECITIQARQVQPIFTKGLPEFNIEPLDPLTLTDLSTKTGTFSLKSTNVVVKGLRKMEIREMKWDLEKKVGHTRIFGNLTFLSDYETDGRILLVPITGTGKLTVKMYNTDLLVKFKIKTFKDADGVEHLQTYDFRPSQQYGNVKIRMTNILGGDVIGDTINQVLNENWRDLMAEVGPPFIKAVADKVHSIINKLYSSVPYDELLLP